MKTLEDFARCLNLCDGFSEKLWAILQSTPRAQRYWPFFLFVCLFPTCCGWWVPEIVLEKKKQGKRNFEKEKMTLWDERTKGGWYLLLPLHPYVIQRNYNPRPLSDNFQDSHFSNPNQHRIEIFVCLVTGWVHLILSRDALNNILVFLHCESHRNSPALRSETQVYLKLHKISIQVSIESFRKFHKVSQSDTKFQMLSNKRGQKIKSEIKATNLGDLFAPDKSKKKTQPMLRIW